MYKMLTIFFVAIVAFAGAMILPIVTTLDANASYSASSVGLGVAYITMGIDNGVIKIKDGKQKFKVSPLTIIGILLVIAGIVTLLI